MPRTVAGLPALAMAFALAACTTAPPTSVRLTLRAGPTLNPDDTGLPNPVQTHVYLLRDAETFNNTDYFQLVGKEKAALGADLLAQDNEILRPGETKALTLPIPPGTKTVAVAASFRNIDQGTWRATTPVHADIVVNLGPQTVQVVQSK